MNTNTELTAPRISVLDAEELDDVIFNIFKTQTDYILKWLPPWILNRFGPEVKAILKYGIWKASVDKSGASFGHQLLHLRYRSSSSQWKLKILAFLSIGGSYAYERLSHLPSENQHTVTISYLLDRISTITKIMNIIIFLRFLRKGGPHNFLEYILNLPPVSTVPTSRRNVGYSYMMRELIWHGFIELLVILIPLINYQRLKRRIMKMIKGPTLSQPKPSRCIFTADSKCVICGEAPILPHQMGCSHCFCYYCLSTNREADNTFECPECGYTNPDDSAMQPIQAFL